MHRDGLPDKGLAADELYIGASLLKHLPKIQSLLRQTGARTMIDYGSGKGRYYERRDIALPRGEVIPSIAEYLELEEVRCYDPAYPPHATLPEAPRDAVISTDALEHCPEEDIAWIVDEMFGLAKKVVFANVASYPASKTLPTGENAHATQRSADWWDDLLRETSSRHPSIRYHFEVEQRETSLRTLFRPRKRSRIVSGG
jgi:hypothetical protein